jgi:hypothetical protein
MTLAWALILTVVMVLLFKAGKLGKTLAISGAVTAACLGLYAMVLTYCYFDDKQNTAKQNAEIAAENRIAQQEYTKEQQIQSSCAKKAEKVFKTQFLKDVPMNVTINYNSISYANMCYIRVTIVEHLDLDEMGNPSGLQPVTTIVVDDVQKGMGSITDAYAFYTDEWRHMLHGPQYCIVGRPDTAHTVCTSYQEFNTLVNQQFGL